MIKLKKELRKYKHIWPVLYVFIYMPWFIMLEKNISADYPGLHILHCPLDDMIPFCEWFVIRSGSFRFFVLSFQKRILQNLCI